MQEELRIKKTHELAKSFSAGDFILRLYVFIFFLVLYSPIIIVVIFSFNEAPFSYFPFKKFTFYWYKEFLNNNDLMQAVFNSIKVGIAATVFSLIVGTLLALAMDEFIFPLKGVFHRVSTWPITFPGVITGVALLLFCSFAKFDLSLITVAIGHITFCIPVVYLEVLARLKAMDKSMVLAAMDLGANRWRAFFSVVLPNITTALLGAALLAFTLSFDEIIVTIFLTGRDNTLPMQIWAMLRRGMTPEINAVGTIILFVSITSVFIWERLRSRDMGQKQIQIAKARLRV
ncbi:MAG: ABC spermidine/putrescine transporter [Candidatus Dadabacteria bacterium CSP1-2]|nr:MAG: ABC spermidine/putrescine transporter [Candidatus Dadabacteria bacterium CSP1-2]